MTLSQPEQSVGHTPKSNAGSLTKEEIYWRDRQKWLYESGYKLRTRLTPGWVPSWTKTKKAVISSEDGLSLLSGQVVDATRIKDGAAVALKKVSKSVHPYEEEISLLFSSDSLGQDPKNHCVPILQVLHPPDEDDILILVMPHLRPYNSPHFDTFGEVIDCFRQLFEGVQFMHHHHVAHRDLNSNNFMLDGRFLYPEGYHPLAMYNKPDMSGPASHYTRTQKPPKYYIIDFGISRQYTGEDDPPQELPIVGGDKTVPEFQNALRIPRNPFPTDIYYIGNMIRQGFLEGHPVLKWIRGSQGFEFMKPLVDDMVQDDPDKRPTIDEVVHRFDVLVKSLSSWKLRSRVAPQKERPARVVARALPHWARRVGYFLNRVPAIPNSGA